MERRRERRSRTFLGGRLSFNQGRSAACLVRNLSPDGALLELPEGTPIPTEPDLYIRLRDQSFKAAVVWRRGDRTGVALAAFRFEDIAILLDDVRQRKALTPETTSPDRA